MLIFSAISCDILLTHLLYSANSTQTHATQQWHTEGDLGGSNPPPEIPKALQNRAKLNPILKTVKNC